jgi:hypothetical protein
MNSFSDRRLEFKVALLQRKISNGLPSTPLDETFKHSSVRGPTLVDHISAPQSMGFIVPMGEIHKLAILPRILEETGCRMHDITLNYASAFSNSLPSLQIRKYHTTTRMIHAFFDALLSSFPRRSVFGHARASIEKRRICGGDSRHKPNVNGLLTDLREKDRKKNQETFRIRNLQKNINGLSVELRAIDSPGSQAFEISSSLSVT